MVPGTTGTGLGIGLPITWVVGDCAGNPPNCAWAGIPTDVSRTIPSVKGVRLLVTPNLFKQDCRDGSVESIASPQNMWGIDRRIECLAENCVPHKGCGLTKFGFGLLSKYIRE